MANVTRAVLGTVRDANFPTNNNNEITASDLRDWLTDGIDSFLTQKDKNVMEEVIWEAKSNNLTAGATTDLSLANGNFVHITGTTTTINSFGICDAGSRFILVFKGVYTLDYDATQLILPGTANITTANNDCCMIVSEGSGNWRVVGYFPIAGGGGGGTVTAVTATTPLASTGGSTPDISIQQATALQSGYLSSTDWNTFDGKQDALSAGTGISLASNTVTNTAPDQVVALTAGTGISTSGTYPNFTIANTAPDQTVGLTAGTGIGITGTYPNFTIANTAPSSGGTVTSIATSSPITGGPITGSGTIGIQDAAADGTTKGAAAFTASDFNATSGVVSLDYTNGQKASGSQPGFLSSTDWTTFNNKGNGTVTSVAASSPLSSSGGTTPNITLGTVPIANGGTNATATPTNGGVAYGTGTAYAFTTAGTSGQLLQSNGAAAPTWVAAPAATLTIGSSVVSGATAGRLLLTTTSGANQVLNQDSLLNYDTTNDRLGIGIASPTATLHLAAGVAANPQMLLVPSAVTPSGTTNGSIWCNTVSSNTRLTMYKDTGYTNVITLDRNPDLATSGSGVVLADSFGTLSKGADLTALGIYAETAGSTIQNTTTATSLFNTVVGSTTLPANFFGVGKTITIFISGTYAQTSGSNTCTIALTIGGVAMGSIALTHSNTLSATYFDAQFTLTCRTAGASGTIQYQGKGVLNTATPSFYFQSSATSGSINTTTTNAIAVTGTWSAANAANILVTGIHYGNYIN